MRNKLFFSWSQTEHRFLFLSSFCFLSSHSHIPLSFHPPISLLSLSLPYPTLPLSLCCWRLANVALANIQRARQAIAFYSPGPYWLSYCVHRNECCAGASKPRASDWYSIYISLQDMLVWGYGFTLSHLLILYVSISLILSNCSHRKCLFLPLSLTKKTANWTQGSLIAWAKPVLQICLTYFSILVALSSMAFRLSTTLDVIPPLAAW